MSRSFNAAGGDGAALEADGRAWVCVLGVLAVVDGGGEPEPLRGRESGVSLAR
jgi:hypothetical protein